MERFPWIDSPGTPVSRADTALLVSIANICGTPAMCDVPTTSGTVRNQRSGSPWHHVHLRPVAPLVCYPSRGGQRGMGGSEWLTERTGSTWQEFLGAGGDISGFQESRWTTVQRIGPGDVLLC